MSESIDDLLVRYLGLLHEYTELRAQLAQRQSSMYANLARANFAAERGFRYGPDHFDGRMQALVKLTVEGGDSAHSFAVVRPKKEAKVEEAEAETNEAKEAETTKKEDTQEKPKSRKTKTKTTPGPRDPLQWYGVLAPMALRQAQTDAIDAVDSLVPRLASLSAEMAAVEIEVRRARKKRTRAQEKQEKESKTLEMAAVSV